MLILRISAAILSAVLVALAFPPWEWAGAGWIGLVPLMLVSRSRDKMGWLYWGAGFLFWLITINWVRHVTYLGMVVLCAYLGLYWMLWGWLWQRWYCRHSQWGSWQNLRLAFWAATGWVALDWVRGVLFSGFPWNRLGISQYRQLPFVQLASLGGVDLLTWLLVFVNAIIALTLVRFYREARRLQPVKTHWDFSLTVALVGLCFVWGGSQLNQKPVASETLEVALIQGNVPQDEKFSPENERAIIERYVRYTHLAGMQSPDLILWPETATGSTFFEDVTFTSEVQQLLKETNYFLLIGALDYDGENYFNSAFLLNSQKESYQGYRKQHLVPFGEFIPGRRWAPWLVNWIPIPMDYKAGQEAGVVTWKGKEREIPLGILICFEDVIPTLARTRVKEGAKVLINLTNDGWFKNSSGAWQHALNAMFRCVETGLPMVRSANTGVSGVIDSRGKWQQMLTDGKGKKVEVEGLLRASVKVPKISQSTWYLRGGYFFPLFCLGITGLFLGYEFYRFCRMERVARALCATQEVSLTNPQLKKD